MSLKKLSNLPLKYPKVITLIMCSITLFLITIAVLPTVWPRIFPNLHSAKIDTDPENMLPENEAVRIFHDKMKKEMSLYDMVVLGIVNESHPNGVFNPESLKKIYQLTEFAKGLVWKDKKYPDKKSGVIASDIIAPSTVENIEQKGAGTVSFSWLMSSPPETDAEALAIREKAKRIPFLNGTLVSEDGKAICIYLPITSKDLSNHIYRSLQEKISDFKGEDKFFITGLPVAEDTFGVEMFKQMAISAPLAMIVIFILMLIFFKKITIIISPMIIAMIAALNTMSLLVATGNTIHIMSSMIPIFIVPIAVLDAVHIISDFFDRFQKTGDRKKVIKEVMDDLFSPMLYTSLTTSIGFISLALTPIPPVQIFGIFVAFGVLMAWIWTILFMPAFIMLLPEKTLENFGSKHHDIDKKPILTSILKWSGKLTFNHSKLILALTFILGIIAVAGIKQIQINDNPINWFAEKHPIRQADKVLNSHFGGTYMGYLAIESAASDKLETEQVNDFFLRLEKRANETSDWLPGVIRIFDDIEEYGKKISINIALKTEFFDRLEEFALIKIDKAEEDEQEVWDDFLLFVDEERQRDELFKQPEALAYIEKLQKFLLTTDVVGKSNSLTDIVKTVYRELISGKEKDFKIPATSKGVAQCLITYQNSHRPQDLWHFVTPDYKKTILWTQLKSGDNIDMNNVVKAVEDFFVQNPPPFPVKHQWFGLTYINVIWQNKMVNGMLKAFAGSFVFVFIIMTILFRSALWGFVCMIPLSVTIGLIYGIIGFMGKDYDMPVAILSSLSLGLAVDYAIHFLARTRNLYEQFLSWDNTINHVFGEPAHAIARNVIVVGFGFTPLIIAPLVPYQTVGIFIAAILFFAGVATLFIVPSLIKILEGLMFPKTKACSFFCNCSTCIITGAAMIFLVIINVFQYLNVGWTYITWISMLVIIFLSITCFILGQRNKCTTSNFFNKNGGSV